MKHRTEKSNLLKAQDRELDQVKQTYERDLDKLRQNHKIELEKKVSVEYFIISET